MSKSIGQIAYEAAAAVTGCEQPWSEANQEKWEAAAAGVREQDALSHAHDAVEVMEKTRAKTIAECREAVEKVYSHCICPYTESGPSITIDDALKALDNLPNRYKLVDKRK